MIQEIDFKTMPRDYAVCWHANCPMAENCLRHLANGHLPKGKLATKSVNLNNVNPMSGSCPMYRPAEMVRLAFGMRHIYDAVRVGDKEMLYHHIWVALGNSMYYRYRNGLCPITPKVQVLIETEFRKMGYTDPVRYDRYEEHVGW